MITIIVIIIYVTIITTITITITTTVITIVVVVVVVVAGDILIIIVNVFAIPVNVKKTITSTSTSFGTLASDDVLNFWPQEKRHHWTLRLVFYVLCVSVLCQNLNIANRTLDWLTSLQIRDLDSTFVS